MKNIGSCSSALYRLCWTFMEVDSQINSDFDWAVQKSSWAELDSLDRAGQFPPLGSISGPMEVGPRDMAPWEAFPFFLLPRSKSNLANAVKTTSLPKRTYGHLFHNNQMCIPPLTEGGVIKLLPPPHLTANTAASAPGVSWWRCNPEGVLLTWAMKWKQLVEDDVEIREAVEVAWMRTGSSSWQHPSRVRFLGFLERSRPSSIGGPRLVNSSCLASSLPCVSLITTDTRLTSFG